MKPKFHLLYLYFMDQKFKKINVLLLVGWKMLERFSNFPQSKWSRSRKVTIWNIIALRAKASSVQQGREATVRVSVVVAGPATYAGAGPGCGTKWGLGYSQCDLGSVRVVFYVDSEREARCDLFGSRKRPFPVVSLRDPASLFAMHLCLRWMLARERGYRVSALPSGRGGVR